MLVLLVHLRGRGGGGRGSHSLTEFITTEWSLLRMLGWLSGHISERMKRQLMNSIYFSLMGYIKRNQVQASSPWVPGEWEKTSALPTSSLLIPWEPKVQLKSVLQQMVLTDQRALTFCLMCTSGFFIYAVSDSNSFSSVFANVMACPFVCMRWSAEEMIPQLMIIHSLLYTGAHTCLGPFLTGTLSMEERRLFLHVEV